MIKKYKIVFDENSSNEESIKKYILKHPFLFFGINKEQIDYNLEELKKQNPKRFEILKKYIDRFESKNNGL